MRIVKQLQDAIRKSGQSLYAVAKGSDVDYTALMRFLSGERGLNLESAAKVAEFLGLELRPIRKAGK